MIAPVARISDFHVCPMQTPAIVPIPHVGGPILTPGVPTVMAGGVPIVAVGDMAICVGGGFPDPFIVGSFTVLAMGRPIVRISDTMAHGGAVLIGLPTVMIGDSGGGGSPQAATMSAAKAGGSAFTRAECNQGAAAAVVRQAPPPSPATGKAWVEVEVVDSDGKPLPYQKVRVTDGGGTARIAYSDAKGIARVDGMAKGQCKITLADLDKSSWEPG
jgi:uncharacterized Zn-binding protein involved in type VI secretion